MILLGVLSGYSWGSFLTYLVFIDIVVLAICFALDRFVWSRDKGQTKNDRRNKRDEGDEEDGVDYRKLNESVVDYNEVKVVDEDSDDDGDAYSAPYGGVTPAGSDLSDDLFEGDEPRMADPDGNADDDGELDVVGMEDPSSGVADDDGDEDEGTDEDDVVKDDDVVTNNNLAYARYLNDDPSCRIISSDDFVNRSDLLHPSVPGQAAARLRNHAADRGTVRRAGPPGSRNTVRRPERVVRKGLDHPAPVGG